MLNKIYNELCYLAIKTKIELKKNQKTKVLRAKRSVDVQFIIHKKGVAEKVLLFFLYHVDW